MSELNLVYRKYGLKDNPYSIRPITVGQETVPSSSFVGREKEIQELLSLLSLGEGGLLVIGDSGVGKTSLVNYVRSKAMKSHFFSLRDEIELNYPLSGQEFLLTTLSAIYRELEYRESVGEKIILSEEITDNLKKIQEISIELIQKNTNEILRIDFNKLKSLFLKIMDELINPRFKGAILHYDNTDNITDFNSLSSMFGEIRDIIETQKVTFIFVGNNFLPQYVNRTRRVADAFRPAPLEVKELKLEEIKDMLRRRIDYFKRDESGTFITPHTDEVLEILFKIHNGNLRAILHSLSTAISSTAHLNEPIKINTTILKEKLLDKLKNKYLAGLTPAEKEILRKILESKLSRFTPTEVSEITKKRVTNISSKYLPKLMFKNTIELIGKEGRNVYYKLSPEIVWWELEKIKEENKKEKKTNNIEKNLKEFF